MAINYQGLNVQIKQIGAKALAAHQQLQKKKNLATALLKKHGQNNEGLCQKVERAASLSSSLQCAFPLEEALGTHKKAIEAAYPSIIIAADGSQIFPDRHAFMNYYLINISTILWDSGGRVPQIHTDSNLYYSEHLKPSEISINEWISIKRDLMEREALVEQVIKLSEEKTNITDSQIVTLSDGTLGLWSVAEQEQKQQNGVHQILQKYCSALTTLYQNQVITAAYVDKPRTDWLLRLLCIAETDETSLKDAINSDAFTGLCDEDVLIDLLKPSERSAVFGIQAQFAKPYQDYLALHFFYLNVGTEALPWIVRVEIPAWVAVRSESVDTLQTAILQQCSLMGTHPYPYLLHRAHEEAVVSMAEKEQLDLMLMKEFWAQNLPLGQESQKQFHKNLLKRRGRMSY